MNIDVYSGDYRVLDSGVIVMDTMNSMLKFDVNSEGKGFRFDCCVEFLTNSNEKTMYSTTSVIDENSILIQCYNFNNTSTNTAMTTPHELAQINGKKIYISLGVNTIDTAGPRIVSYTFYEK